MFFLRNGLRLALLAPAVAIAMPAMATAAARPNGYPVTSVNLRAGPGTDYPKILTVPARAPIYILGCLGDYTWCDVVFARNRGWMRWIYLEGFYQGYYYTASLHGRPLGLYRPLWMDVGVKRAIRLGDLSLRPLGILNRAVFYSQLAPFGNWVWL